jgi:integrase
MADYHLFKKPRVKNGKTIHKWYYYYLVNGRQIQKSCKRCTAKAEAEAFIKKLPRLSGKNSVLVKTIAETMFIPGSEHMKRRIQLGKPLERSSIMEARNKIRRIIELWGDRALESLTAGEVGRYLFSSDKSGSWKILFLANLKEVYTEASWYGCTIPIPLFPKFSKKSRKADIFTTEELNKLLVPENFLSGETYLFFLCLLSGGLRLGEAAGIRVKQVLFESRALIIDGFIKSDHTRAPYNKKGSAEHPKARIVPLPDLTLGRLKEHIEKNKYRDEDFIFRSSGDRTKPVVFSQIQHALPRAMKKAGIKADGRKLVIHSFRYTYVTRMRRELPADMVMKLVGHTSVEQTDYYNKKVIDTSLKDLIGAGAAAANLFS